MRTITLNAALPWAVTMPCDSVTTQSVNLANAVQDVLRGALVADGWTINTDVSGKLEAWSPTGRLTWERGRGLTMTGIRTDETIAAVTTAYAKAAVSWAAQRAGWTVAKADGNKLTLNRR